MHGKGGFLFCAAGFLLSAAALPNRTLMSSEAFVSQPEQEVTAQVDLVVHHLRGDDGPEFLESASPRWLASAARPQDTLIFLVIALIIGTLVLHLTLLPSFKGLEYSVVMFVLGIFYSLVFEGADVTEALGGFGTSYSLFMKIQPTTILATMLPALLMGPALTIDTSVARHASWQCLWLAGPAVLINALLVGLFIWIYLPYQWPFRLSLTLGAIFGATNPDAVVDLLTELGASPTLRIQIQGEALLNTGVILYLVTYDILKGTLHEPGDVVVQGVKLAVCASLLGILLGQFFSWWIKKARDRADAKSPLIQISLTMCCAYSAFMLADYLHISGAHCTIFAGLVLGDTMWPNIIDRDSLKSVWGMLQHLAGTIILFLSGALVGNVMVQIPAIDYLHLLVIYLALMLIRFLCVFGSVPLLHRLNVVDRQSVTWANATVISWGGLRGAVGLAFAIQVKLDRAGGTLDALTADRVLFYVGGVAALTHVINAPTSPALVRLLGITKTPWSGVQMMKAVCGHLHLLADGQCNSAAALVLSSALSEVTKLLEAPAPLGHGDGCVEWEPGSVIASRLRRARSSLSRSTRCAHKDLLRDLPELPNISEQDLTEIALREGGALEVEMVRAVNEAFLKLVRSEYWRQIDAGAIHPNQASLLLRTNAHGIEMATCGLRDFVLLLQLLSKDHEPWLKEDSEEGPSDNPSFERNDQDVETGEDMSEIVRSFSKKSRRGLRRADTLASLQQLNAMKSAIITDRLQLLAQSFDFNLLAILLVMVNSIFLWLQVPQVDPTTGGLQMLWVVWTMIFSSVFILECTIRMLAFRSHFFKSGWHVMDFLFVLLSAVVLILDILTLRGYQVPFLAVIWQFQALRSVHVFRLLPLLEQVNLERYAHRFRAWAKGREVSSDLLVRLQTVGLLLALSEAHCAAQEALLLFGGNGGKPSCEVARCILESRTIVLEAMTLASEEGKTLAPEILSEMHSLRLCKQSLDHMLGFLKAAHQGGFLTMKEAETLMGPLHRRLQGLVREELDNEAGLLHAEVIQNPESELIHLATMSPRASGREGFGEWELPAEQDLPPHPIQPEAPLERSLEDQPWADLKDVPEKLIGNDCPVTDLDKDW